MAADTFSSFRWSSPDSDDTSTDTDDIMALSFERNTMFSDTKSGYVFSRIRTAANIRTYDTPNCTCRLSQKRFLSRLRTRRLCLEIVTNSPLGHDVFGRRGILFELLAQTPDVYVNGTVIACVAVAPDNIHEVLAAVDAARIAHK